LALKKKLNVSHVCCLQHLADGTLHVIQFVRGQQTIHCCFHTSWLQKQSPKHKIPNVQNNPFEEMLLIKHCFV